MKMKNLTNKVQLIGNAGAKPSLKELANNKKIAHLSLATHESYKDAKGGRQVRTCWHNVIAWNAMAEALVKHADKGKKMALEGKLLQRSYTDDGGVRRYVHEIQLQNFMILNSSANS
jgi:single-strand DNA-binding protein